MAITLCVPARRRWLAHTALACAALLATPLAYSQSAWPSKPVKIIVPYNAGGATDIVARVVAERLGNRLGQPFLVENRGGASGIVGTDATAKAAPDGYVFTISLSSSLLLNQFLFKKLPYDPARDLVLISQIAMAPVTLVVHPSIPANTGPELMEYIRKNKGKMTYGSWGVGSYAHLGGAYMSQTLDGDMTHVAYKGEAPMLQDLIGGQIQMAFASALGTKPYVDNGRLKIIGVTGAERMEVLPNASTLAEQGLKDDAYSAVGWVGLAAPAKTPADIVARISAEVQAIVQLPEVRERISAMGFVPVGNTPAAFLANYKREFPVWEALVKQSGAQLD